jgi:hypothetical protein
VTCPDFQTTPVFLQIHRRQAATNTRLIAQAGANGQQRLAANLRRVQASLDQIIPALEALKNDGPSTASTPQPSPDDPATTPTAAAETCLRRRNARLPGIIYRQLQITAVLDGNRARPPPGGGRI